MKDDLIYRRQAIHAFDVAGFCSHDYIVEVLRELPPAQTEERLKKISDLLEGTIDHFDRDDAIDLIYQIKEVLKND